MKQPLKALVLAISLSCGAIGAYANSLEPLDKEFTLQVLGSGGLISDDLRSWASRAYWRAYGQA